MVENLEHLLRRAWRFPRAPRAALYKELLRSETYLLTVDDPIPGGETRRVTRADASFPVWADKDPELGGVWVPVFPARDRVREFVAARGLKAPRGKEFLWMGHMPGQVFSLLRGVRRFAGLRLHLDAATGVDLPWRETLALAEGRLPDEAPERWDLPIERLVIPAGERISLGRLAPWDGEPKPALLTMPQAGRFRPEDLRRLVRLPLGEGRYAWTPCRHFLQILRRLKSSGAVESDRFVENLLASQLSFEMYGEAEALCEWLAARGQEAFAWMGLAVVYGRTGRLDECAALCRRAVGRYPGERAFHVNGLRALIALGRREEAARRVEAAVRLFPQDAVLAELGRELSDLAPHRV
ncbi:MAG: tetratricopeptide repeat protein [Elusimicrobia bacterium]|nr:tetratricopeptide repeat protein [Elusimicrobiota bacterium]